MSDFRKYAERMDVLAKETREAAQKVEDAYKRAEDARRQYPNDPVKKARAEADYQEALQAKNNWKMNKPFEIEQKIKAIRAELETALDNHFAADPAALDAPTLELLKSGILTSAEYSRLLDKAIEDDNSTMARLIASYAEKAAADIAERYGTSDVKARELRAVAYQAQRMGGTVYLNNFAVLTEALTRSVRNPGLWPQWEELTGEVIARGF